MSAFIKLHISSLPLNYFSLSVEESTYTSVEVRLFSGHLFVNRHQLSEVRDKVMNEGTQWKLKKKRILFLSYQRFIECLSSCENDRLGDFRPCDSPFIDWHRADEQMPKTQLSSGVPSLAWKPGFEKMVRVGREKNLSSVFFLINPVARLLGKPK